MKRSIITYILLVNFIFICLPAISFATYTISELEELKLDCKKEANRIFEEIKILENPDVDVEKLEKINKKIDLINSEIQSIQQKQRYEEKKKIVLKDIRELKEKEEREKNDELEEKEEQYDNIIWVTISLIFFLIIFFRPVANFVKKFIYSTQQNNTISVPFTVSDRPRITPKIIQIPYTNSTQANRNCQQILNDGRIPKNLT